MVALHHQEVQKQQQKAWHDRHLRKKEFGIEYLVLMYDSRIKDKPRKLETAWLGPYLIEDIKTNAIVQIKALQGKLWKKVVNGARPKKYHS